MNFHNTIWFLAILVSGLCGYVLSGHTTICTNTRFGPSNDINSYNGNPGSNSGQAYFHDTNYNFDCCGVLKQFEAKVSIDGELFIQIWAPVSGGYQLVGHFSEYCDSTNNGGKCTRNLAGAEKITILPTYKWGWWTAGADMVSTSNDVMSLQSFPLTNPQANDIFDWSTNGNTLTSSDRHGIQVTVDKNDDPNFTTLTDGGTVTDSIAETATIGTSVFAVSATDGDVSDVSSLVITMTSSSSYFDFNQTSGEVTVKNNLGAATSPQTLTFSVEDQCHNTKTATLSITIINEPPVIENLPNSTTIPETTNTRKWLTFITVTDSNDPLTCYITPADTKFSLEQFNASVWELYTVYGASFDYTNLYHDVPIQCDDGQDTVDGTFRVNLTPNQPPVIQSTSNSTSFHEDESTEFLCLPFNVTDSDTPTVSCNFGAGTSGTGASKFRIRKQTGSSGWGIYTLAGMTFDYIAENIFTLEVECDDGRDVTTSIFYVYLDPNERPVITNLPTNVTLSLKAPTGHNVYYVTSTDVEHDQLHYDISCTPSPCDVIVFDSGHIELNTNAAAITGVGFEVNVTVRDHRNYGLSKTLTVLIVDINVVPTIDNLGNTVSIPENSPFNELVETVQCSDSDVPVDTLAYYMSCTPPVGSTLLQIDSSNGQISTSPATLINYEPLGASSDFTCTVTCSDGEDSDTANFDVSVIDVNEAPAFAQNAYSVFIDEGASGTPLQDAPYSVYDPDTVDTKRFTIVCDTSYFIVDDSTGLMSFATDYDVDSGNRPLSATCDLTVTDSGGLWDTVPVDITINDVNDNVPIFSPSSYAIFAEVSSNVGKAIDYVTVSDNDVTILGDITLSIDQSLVGCDCFGVTNDGKIFVKNSLETIGAGNTVTFEVLATDGGGEERRATVVVVVVDTPVAVETERYLTFFDDVKNIAWFSVCIVLLVAITIFIAYLLCTAENTTTFACRCCRQVPKIHNEESLPETDNSQRQCKSVECIPEKRETQSGRFFRD